MSYNGYYAADGSMNITVVGGSSYTGVYAVDGSINVVPSSGSSYVGSMHPCGAIWVTLQTSGVNSIRAADGSLNISQSTYQTGTQKVTVVSGSFGPSTPGAIVPLFF